MQEIALHAGSSGIAVAVINLPEETAAASRASSILHRTFTLGPSSRPYPPHSLSSPPLVSSSTSKHAEDKLARPSFSTTGHYLHYISQFLAVIIII